MSNSWTITDAGSSVDLEHEGRSPPLTPGEMLRDHFMADMALTPDEVARAMGVTLQHVSELLDGRAAVNAEDSVRLGHAFAMSDGFWLNLQTRFDVETARRALSGELDRLPVLVAA